MAWPFQLAVECGENSSTAARVKTHFDEVPCTLQDSRNAKFSVDAVGQDEDRRWWVSVLVFIGDKGLQSGDDPALLAMAGKQLYERLKSATGYRFAVVGIDCYQFNRIESIPRLLPGSIAPGFVVSEDLFQQFGRPDGFTRFSQGYFWLPSDYKYDR